MELAPSWKTAMMRRGSSRPCRLFWRIIAQRLFRDQGRKRIRLLDFGCGHGNDLEFYEDSSSVEAVGYDPHFMPDMPTGLFDVVMCNYVLNVIETEEQRLEALTMMWSFVKPRGYLFLAARPSLDIEFQAQKSGWTPHGDGWVTKKGTFQHGMTNTELDNLVFKVAGQVHTWQPGTGNNYACLAVHKGEEA